MSVSDGALTRRLLPGCDWATPSEGRLWLKRERARLGWTHKDVESAFSGVANASDLYLGPGGGPLFPRATEKRVKRFEAGGEAIPDWLYWIPLAIERAAVPREDWWKWDREHVPENSDVRRDRELDQEYARTYELADDEIELLHSYRALGSDHRIALRIIAKAGEEIIDQLLSSFRRSDPKV